MGGMLLHSNGLIHLIINKQAWSKLPSTNAIIDVSAVFLTLLEGGIKPMFKILLQIFYYSKGLFGNIKLGGGLNDPQLPKT